MISALLTLSFHIDLHLAPSTCQLYSYISHDSAIWNLLWQGFTEEAMIKGSKASTGGPGFKPPWQLLYVLFEVTLSKTVNPLQLQVCCLVARPALWPCCGWKTYQCEVWGSGGYRNPIFHQNISVAPSVKKPVLNVLMDADGWRFKSDPEEKIHTLGNHRQGIILFSTDTLLNLKLYYTVGVLYETSSDNIRCDSKKVGWLLGKSQLCTPERLKETTKSERLHWADQLQNC